MWWLIPMTIASGIIAYCSTKKSKNEKEREKKCEEMTSYLIEMRSKFSDAISIEECNKLLGIIERDDEDLIRDGNEEEFYRFVARFDLLYHRYLSL